MPPRVPTEADFESLSSTLPVALHFPSPPESTSAFLILFHGLGDHETPFASFARNLSLPGVLAISVRGTSPLPPSLLPDRVETNMHFHWGNDLKLDPATGDLDDDPGFDKAAGLVMNKLIKETLIDKCGWEMRDILFFGFGQGGSLALGMASRLRTANSAAGETAFKGAISVGGPLPMSMVPTASAREQSQTSLLLCQLDDEQVEAANREFRDVRTAKWKRSGVSMPQDSDEVLPIMKFFADRLKTEE